VEDYAIVVLLGELALALLVWIWLLVRAFNQHVAWGIASLVLPPLALVFAWRHAQRAVGPLVVFALGTVALAIPAACSLAWPSDVAFHERIHQEPAFFAVARTSLESDAAHGWMEGRAYYMNIGGGLLALLAWIWLVVRAFRERRSWGLGTLFFPPLGFIFADRYPRKGAVPLACFLVCSLVVSLPAIYTNSMPRDTSARDRNVLGQEHLTLTGADPKTAPDLKQKKNLTLLQMAGPDVDDQSLESLKGMNLLQELDLSGTRVTDAGLETLKELPALARLHLARTKITDKGFRSALFAKESLMELDLRDTQVSRETTRAWHDAKQGRRVMQ
jgi:Leucine Rich repeat